MASMAAFISLPLLCSSPELSDIDWDQSFVETKCPASIQYSNYIEEEYSELYFQTISMVMIFIIVYTFSRDTELCPMIVFTIDT